MTTTGDLRQTMPVAVMMSKAAKEHIKQGKGTYGILIVDDKCQSKGELKPGKFKAKIECTSQTIVDVMSHLLIHADIRVKLKIKYTGDKKPYYDLTEIFVPVAEPTPIQCTPQ